MKTNLLFILCALFISAQTAQAQTWNIGYPNAEDVTATLNVVDSTLTISGIGDMQNNAPWFSLRANIRTIVIEQGVTSIGNNAFSLHSNLTSVTIPYGIRSIGQNAFMDCTALTEITIPNSVTSIGSQAFLFCKSLITVNIGSGLTSLTGFHWYDYILLTAINVDTDNPAFSSENGVLFNKDKTTLIRFPMAKPVTTYIIPNSVTTIERFAFQGSGLTEITIPNSVTTIRSNAFWGCFDLTAINVDAENTMFSSENGVLFNKNKTTLIQFPPGKQGAYTIPYGVITIGNDAFKDCFGLTEITIPNSVTTIGMGAFEGCTGLTTVTIGNNVTTIGSFAFRGCTGLTEIIIPNSVITIGSFAFQGCTGLTTVTIGNSVTTIGDNAFNGCIGLTEITIPNSVTTIGANAFMGCTGLTEVIIPNSVTTIGGGAFRNCTGLTSVTIGNSVTTIGHNAFMGCTGLTEITIPNSVTTIGVGVFYGCINLREITIPNSVTFIGNFVFSGCTGLTDIYVYWDTPPSINANVFSGVVVQNIRLHIPHGTLSTYQNAPFWRDFILVERAETSIGIINNDNVKLYTTSNGIFIETKESVQIAVYNLSGQMLYRAMVFGSREIPLPIGVYIVRVNNESEKVIVR